MATNWRARPPDNDVVCLRQLQDLEVDRWRLIFDKYDEIGCGEITVWALRQLLQDPDLLRMADRHVLTVLDMKCATNRYTFITFQEFVNIMSNRRTTSFRLAVETEGPRRLVPVTRDIVPYQTLDQPETNPLFRAMVRRLAREFLTDDLDRQYYADHYTCCPPPLFVPLITFVEVGCFLYNNAVSSGGVTVNGPFPTHSMLIYRPDRRIEVWRFVLYMFVHAGWVHLFFNMLIQVVVGIPLEMVHGPCRIAVIYTAGVLAGSLGTSVFDPGAVLVGASGGVYALLAGHLANIMLNYTNMELGFLKFAAILFIASADVGFAVWDRYTERPSKMYVGYTAHLMGAVAGLSVGVVVLKNFEQKLHEYYMWWVALAVYTGCVAFSILWNIYY